MERTIFPHKLGGRIAAIPSKSQAHRLLICAALADEPTALTCPEGSQDIEATVRCLTAFGAAIRRTETGYAVQSAQAPERAEADCGESGSTLRFLLPVAAALGIDTTFCLHGRLAARPLSPLWEELEAHGCALSRPTSDTVRCTGRLTGGVFRLAGNISSQFISGLLLALPMTGTDSELVLTTPLESAGYVDMTLDALRRFGVRVECTQNGWRIPAGARYASCGAAEVEGDWSNAAFWLAAGALSDGGVAVTGLDLSSAQGDRSILAALSCFGARVARRGGTARVTKDRPRATTLDVSDFPDLVPPLAAVAALCPGTTRLTHAGRLRLKESDRLETVSTTLRALGADARAEGDDLVIVGRESLLGGEVDSANDHRIAMMAAVAATRATGDVTIRGAECVSKSYPAFFEDYELLGGSVTRKGDEHAL